MIAIRGNYLLFIFGTVCLDAIGLGIIIPVLPDLLKEVLSADIATAALWGGLLSASYAITQFIFGPLLGSLSDQYGRRPVLLLGLAVLFIDYLVMGFANSIELLLIGRLMAGASGSTFVTAKAFIADISPREKRAANFGMVGAGFGIGFILGPVMGGLLGEYGTRAPFFVAAFLVLLNLCYGYFVLPETLKPKDRRSFSWARSNPFSGLLLIRAFPGLGWIFLALAAFNIAHFVYPAVWSFWGQAAFGWSSFQVGVSLALVGIGFALVQGLLIRKLLPIYGEIKVAIWAFGVTFVSFIIYGFVSSASIVYLTLPLVALGALVTPALDGVLSNAVDDNEQGMLQGVISGMTAIASIISPLLMTNLFYRFSMPESALYLPGAPFLMAALLCAVAIFAFIRGVKSGAVVDSARIDRNPTP